MESFFGTFLKCLCDFYYLELEQHIALELLDSRYHFHPPRVENWRKYSK